MRHVHAGIFGASGIIVLIQLVIIGVIIGVPVLAIGAALLFRLRSARRVPAPPAEGSGPRAQYLEGVRRWGRTGLLAGVVAGLLLIAAGGDFVLAALCCGVGYLLGLLIGELVAGAPERDLLRTASLLIRRPADYAPGWARYLALACVLLLIAAPVVFCVAPGIRYAAWHPAPGVPITLRGGTTSWPGLITSAGCAALAVVALLLGELALHQVAVRPRAAERQDPAADELLRLQAGRAVTGAVLAIELLLLGGMLVVGSGGLAVPDSTSAAYLASRVLIWSGLACTAGGVASWLILSGWIRKSRTAALLAPAPASPRPATPAAE